MTPEELFAMAAPLPYYRASIVELAESIAQQPAS